MYQKINFKSHIALLILFISMMSLTSAVKVEDKSTEIINNYIEAIGGKKKIEKLKLYQAKGVWKMPGQTMNYEAYAKFHDKLAVVVTGNSFHEKTVYDNGQSMSIRNDSSFVNNNQAALNAYELDCWILPIAHKEIIKNSIYNGDIVRDNILCEEVRIIFKNGVEWVILFDKKSHLIYNIRTTTGMNIIYKKHETIDGILFPVEFEFNLKQTGQFKLILNSIKINQNIPESTFKL